MKKIPNSILFIIPSLIWGSTWYVITMQLGKVAPILSVSYRFFLASLVLFAFCFLKKVNLKLDKKAHLLIAFQGACLFGFNYWMVYMAEEKLPSGLISMIHSLLIIFIMFLSRVVLKTKLKPIIYLAAAMGVGGTFLVFQPELANLSINNTVTIALILCLLSISIAATGNILSALVQKRKIEVIPSTAWAMLYGSVFLFITAIATHTPITFDFSSKYILSMAYLVVFGSVIAFTLYLQLLGRIGPDRSGYAILIIPIISIIISAIFEGLQLNYRIIIALMLIIAGNIIVLKVKKREKKA